MCETNVKVFHHTDLHQVMAISSDSVYNAKACDPRPVDIPYVDCDLSNRGCGSTVRGLRKQLGTDIICVLNYGQMSID